MRISSRANFDVASSASSRTRVYYYIARVAGSTRGITRLDSQDLGVGTASCGVDCTDLGVSSIDVEDVYASSVLDLEGIDGVGLVFKCRLASAAED